VDGQWKHLWGVDNLLTVVDPLSSRDVNEVNEKAMCGSEEKKTTSCRKINRWKERSTYSMYSYLAPCHNKFSKIVLSLITSSYILSLLDVLGKGSI
jgi:hypothetical protein